MAEIQPYEEGFHSFVSLIENLDSDLLCFTYLIPASVVWIARWLRSIFHIDDITTADICTDALQECGYALHVAGTSAGLHGV